MVIIFLLHLMLDGVVGVVVFLVVRRVLRHMAEDPQAAELISKHVIAPILSGQKKDTPEVKKANTRLV